MQMGGAFNAFATRFFGRDFLVLYSDVVDALADNPDALNFYIGHEIGHIKRKHLKWSTVLLPASMLPLIGAAYSRAREYTCDRHGLAACDSPLNAEFGMAALAAGGKRWRTMSKTSYIARRSTPTASGCRSMNWWATIRGWSSAWGGALAGARPGTEPAAAPSDGGAAGAVRAAPRHRRWQWADRDGGDGRRAGGGGDPAYQDLPEGAGVRRVLERACGRPRSGNLLFTNEKVPATLEAAGVSAQPADNGAVELIQLNPVNAQIKVLTRIVSPHRAGNDHVHALARCDKRIAWKCSAEDLRPQVLPPDCR